VTDFNGVFFSSLDPAKNSVLHAPRSRLQRERVLDSRRRAIRARY